MIRFLAASSAISLAAALSAGGCSSSSSPNTGPATGTSCATAASCYVGLDAATLHGSPTCLTSVSNGYCTHPCQADADCCAVPGECGAGVKEVCAPFESTAQTYCFVSCASGDIPASAGTTDPNVYCARFNAAFTCRSTGGGSANQKFCGA